MPVANELRRPLARVFGGALVLLSVTISPSAAKGPEDFELFRETMIGGREDAFEDKPWAEAAYQLPPAPDAKNLIRIDVGTLTDNEFAIDEQSVSFGPDEVVRYTLVISSPRGARNVSYEGIRCATGERRLYAFGRPDGTWSKARSDRWVKIAENSLNRHHAALFRDYFCTTGGTVSSTDEARRVLPKGNPAAQIR